MTPVVVTGATGMLGYEVASGIRNRDVIAIHRSAPPNAFPETVRSCQTRDLYSLDWIDALPPDVAIIHCAGVANPRSDYKSGLKDGMDAEVALFGRLADTGWRGRLILSSSSAVYGAPGREPVPETADLSPVSSYGHLKLAIEMALLGVASTYGIKMTILRFASLYGSRATRPGQGIVRIIKDHLAEGTPLALFGTGESTRDYLHIADAVAAISAALDIEDSGPFNIGTGVATSVNDLIALTEELTGRNLPIEHRSAACEAGSTVLDPTRASERLGWRPAIELEDGLRRYFEA